MLTISPDMGAAQQRRDRKKEHYKKIHFNYVRLVKINSLRAHLCAYSFIQMLRRSFRTLPLQTTKTSSSYKQQYNYLEKYQMNVQARCILRVVTETMLTLE